VGISRAIHPEPLSSGILVVVVVVVVDEEKETVAWRIEGWKAPGSVSRMDRLLPTR